MQFRRIQSELFTWILIWGLLFANTSCMPNTTGSIQTAPANYYLYVPNFSSGGGISGFSINTSTGLLGSISGSPFPTSSTNPQIAITDPTNSFLYVSSASAGYIMGYNINSQSGYLSQNGSTNTNISSPFGMAMASLGQLGTFLYSGASNGSTSIGEFACMNVSGTLANLGASNAANGYSQSMVITPNNRFLYTSSSTTANALQTFSISSSNGQISSQATTGTSSFALTWLSLTPNGQFLYGMTGTGQTVVSYLVNPSTGGLSGPTSTSISGAGLTTPSYATMDPLGRFIYIGDHAGAKLDVFSINSSNGALTLVPGSPFLTSGGSVYGIAAEPTGNYIYTMDYGNGTITEFKVNASTGALSTIGMISTVAGTYPSQGVVVQAPAR